MDVIKKAILFGGKAIVSIVDIKELSQKAINLQKTSDGAGEVLSRCLAMGAFLSAGIKGANIKMSMTIDGDGTLGKIIVAGETGGVVRGFVENRDVDLPLLDNGKYDIASGIGSNGYISVIKDFGLKEPYLGRASLVNGNLDANFAYYLTVSEQLPSAVSSGAIVKNGEVLSSGLIIVQPMPNCEEEYIVVLQDIVRNFTDFASLLIENSPEEIINYHFGHFECKILPDIYPRFECKCSQEKMDTIVKSLGKEDAMDIINTDGKIEIHCDFCNHYYTYYKEDVDKIFEV